MNGADTDGVFEIGLAMAGAISGGAYAAGVVDFLIQALDEWEKAKTTHPNDDTIPRHTTRIRVLSGASAGGMTAAVLAASLHEGFLPVAGLAAGQPAPTNNTLYQCWVNRIDISHFLGVLDLGPGKQVVSLLDSTVLDGIAEYAFGPYHRQTSGVARAYVDEHLEIFLTIANLRGVPYSVQFRGWDTTGHEQVQHQDHVRFVLGRTPPDQSLGDGIFLNAATRSGRNWDVFRTAALATGAFPVGLAPKVMTLPMAPYGKRTWDIPREVECPEPGKKKVKFDVVPITPDWEGGSVEPEAEWDFMAVDGGLMNNEPFELARKALAGSDCSNPRPLELARRAVLMVDPFPEPAWDWKATADTYRDADVVQAAKWMFSALKAQARFKPEEVALALEEDIYSRFILTPSAGDAGGNWPAMAAASLGGFGGFLSRKFRNFDFQLGRRNCQKFLKDHFVLPLDTPQNIAAVRNNLLFGGYPRLADSPYKDSKKAPVLPIIPLCGAAIPEEPLIPRETITMTDADIAALEAPIQRRIKALAATYVAGMDQGFTRWFIKRVVNWKAAGVARELVAYIRKDLKNHALV
ncbi:hypothetical protein G3N56_01335 [Desulfovibrio sulfodismutans]|uniref:PNPLA domain-containing protein n=1 Tax=Desulfolutivibrio sulfodismutans TaxID=63561 RepID=A0A7K3NGR0_9BACT|nr:patatin-like phospholipase family protein [Desulfolutivibrio sulfodismutans]NDY55386.1 hypothetical protein [Desulfolutivibrio sulfodismutans]QLA12238.1 hypothetical protein GD606_08105 [Desulfolutivibrio sulfodismutans DSM 3696]